MVGASSDPTKFSYGVLRVLHETGYDMIPVNPREAGTEIRGLMCQKSLSTIDRPVDMVQVFRKSEAAYEIVEEAIEIGAKVVWMQLGVRNDEAARRAEAAGLKVVMNRCPKIEYGRLTGELGWAGVNTRKISNNRPQMAAFGVQDHRLKRRT